MTANEKFSNVFEKNLFCSWIRMFFEVTAQHNEIRKIFYNDAIRIHLLHFQIMRLSNNWTQDRRRSEYESTFHAYRPPVINH